MKLLIITQKVNIDDPILGFFHRWIIEFSKHCQSVVVICLEKGRYDLPNNVRVRSLGKPDQGWSGSGGERFLSKIKALVRFYKYIWQERKNYDAVFVHMNPVYLIVGGIVWYILGKKISLWYTHKRVDWKLRFAETLVDRIFTASRESFRLKSRKVLVTGHGIDVDFFMPSVTKVPNNILQLVTVGRIASVKNYQIMIDGVSELKKNGKKLTLTIIGEPITKVDEVYCDDLKKYVIENDLQSEVVWVGSLPQNKIIQYLQVADIFINMSHTGSIDKAVLEAMACGVRILTSNDAFKNILSCDQVTDGSLSDLISKIESLDSRAFSSINREYILQYHSLSLLIPKLVYDLQSL